MTESYGLSADGKHLVEKLHIASSELPAVTITRVYDPTSETGAAAAAERRLSWRRPAMRIAARPRS